MEGTGICRLFWVLCSQYDTCLDFANMSFLGHQFDHNFDTRNVLSVTYASSKLGYLLRNTLVPGCTNEDLHLRPLSVLTEEPFMPSVRNSKLLLLELPGHFVISIGSRLGAQTQPVALPNFSSHTHLHIHTNRHTLRNKHTLTHTHTQI